MDPLTKTWFSLGLVFVALFNFWTAMRVFGKTTPSPNPKLYLRLHRIGGYVFLFYFALISWICIDLMARLSAAGKPLDVRGFYHGMLSFTLFFLLLLKISFVRFFRKFQPQAGIAIGITMTVGTLVIWSIAGWMFLILVS
ncbi:MAG TPA: hypothetical protein DIC34_09350 [Treponema sp.]|nr:MAG: hypothetical protein A2Y36_05265 [Treponema sp. GWA1_62_8]OHE64432.1 MAG: hypothetical protein A2001_02095 [Treponema sp. GWC1_61_84]OHE76327.1 MAG: hypothetical protein A2413_16250 [Treponema sp. RIFOXYC1_FULL_61_9]HCM26733.1 hypothetical protein [Treponema sp.]